MTLLNDIIDNVFQLENDIIRLDII